MSTLILFTQYDPLIEYEEHTKMPTEPLSTDGLHYKHTKFMKQVLTKAYSLYDWGQWGFLAKVNYCKHGSIYPVLTEGEFSLYTPIPTL